MLLTLETTNRLALGDTTTYQKGIKVSDAEMKTLDIQGDAFHHEWNYTIRPRSADRCG